MSSEKLKALQERARIRKEQFAAARDDMLGILKKHEHLTADQMLALAAHLVGQLIAMQDQRKMTPEQAMQLVVANIEAGNLEARRQVMSASTAVRN